MSGAGRGYAAALAAYSLWGLSPAFWPLLAPADAVESVAHRVAWTLIGMLGVITVARRWADLRGLAGRTWLLVLAGSVLIAVNWGVYIWATTNGHVVDAALGYYATPLVSVLLAVLVLRERLRPAQWVAIGLAVVAVVVLTVGTGRLPWITLVLAMSFGVYGLVKKRVPLDPVPGLTAEGFLLGPLAIVFIVWLQATGAGTFTGHGVGHALLLMAAGPVTALPLLLFAAGAKRLTLATLGVLQYVNPTLQFLWGVLVAGEPMPVSRWIGVSLVWAALVVFTADALRVHARERTLAL
ncbi:EamA family transporter RarD [Actinomycetospora lemnae]|uniref:EamA family transporter RarD n=1 Tax=Actinomycetospora lemnae TaxID=3019891 RepID=A0ABT5ST21_9PSEU|nr:EamA family transporter RarD [Actinomycetospora sp. DW7H6]MDD7965978.1 EamA family transporter RarD [Actinomycetospora sp. DW7H6]